MTRRDRARARALFRAMQGDFEFPGTQYHRQAVKALRLAAAYRAMPSDRGFYWFARIEVGFARWYRAKAADAGFRLP